MNSNTIVVVNTGAPVAMPWAGDAPAAIQAWFGGQEAGHALAAVLFGDADPGGRLPTTLPLRLEHNPSFGNFPGENGQVRYGEGLLTGYRWYDARRFAVRFPFGHGLSYTAFAIGAPTVSASLVAPGEPVTLTVPVTNTGDRKGSEVESRASRPCSGRRPGRRPHLEERVRAAGRAPVIPDMAWVWHIQVALILFGHIASVYLAHVVALRVFATRRDALLSQLPMLCLMVFFTVAGLWILALPLQSGAG